MSSRSRWVLAVLLLGGASLLAACDDAECEDGEFRGASSHEQCQRADGNCYLVEGWSCPCDAVCTGSADTCVDGRWQATASDAWGPPCDGSGGSGGFGGFGGSGAAGGNGGAGGNAGAGGTGGAGGLGIGGLAP